MSDISEFYPDVFDPTLETSEGEIRHPDNIRHKRLYLALRHLLIANFSATEEELSPDPRALADAPESERVRFLAVYGQLLMRGFEDASIGRLERGTAGRNDLELHRGLAGEAKAEYEKKFGTERIPDYRDGRGEITVPFRVTIVDAFDRAVTEAVHTYNVHRELYRQTFLELREQAHGKVNGVNSNRTISTKLLASVAERLINDRLDPNNPLIVTQIRNAIATTIGGGGVGGAFGSTTPSARELFIPDLDAGTAVEILPDNVQAVRFIYFSAQLELMKLHPVHDKIVEHFQIGMLPVSRGAAADKLHSWIKRTQDRITEAERRALYGRVLGIAQGGTDVMPNRDFNGLWIRFLATVSQKFREISSTERDRVSVEQVHKSARDLAVNLSLHGYGWASPAATEMVDLVNEMLAVLDEPAILQAYGVRDRWQLVDRVSALYLGGAVNGVKYRAMAQAGQLIINWLAESAAVLASGSAAGLRIVEWRGNRRVPTKEFQDLADLCERWLAATGTSDGVTEQNTDPVDLPTQMTVPMMGFGQNGAATAMPREVQDALDQLGGAALPNLPVIPQA